MLWFWELFLHCWVFREKQFCSLLGQDEEMVRHGGRVLRIFVLSIPFILMYVNANFFLQSIRRPYVGMYGIIAANVLNIAINPLLVYGKFGLPEMGAGRFGNVNTDCAHFSGDIHFSLYPQDEEKSQAESAFWIEPQLSHMVE